MGRISIFVAAILAEVLCINGNLFAYSGDGDGSAGKPYQIANVADFQQLTIDPNNWDKAFILTSDLDLAGVTLTPIAPDMDDTQPEYQGTPFIGTFDGNNHVIRNAVINKPAKDYVGRFGQIGTGGQIKNVGIKDARIKGRDVVGGLVGQSYGTIISCNIAGGEVLGNNTIGGMCGGCEGSINDSYASSTVGGSRTVGGFLGYNNAGAITSCYATGAASGSFVVGGFIGSNSTGAITSCYATGAVIGVIIAHSGDMGGLIGWNGAGAINSSYATGAVNGAWSTGGLVGANGGAITHCHATGSVSGTDGAGGVGGLVGSNGATIKYSYSTGEVNGPSAVGGLAGTNANGVMIDSCYATGNVNGRHYGNTGGLVGSNGGIIVYSYAFAIVINHYGGSNTGGLVGYQDVTGVIDSSYAEGEVSSGGNNVGGLVGNNYHGAIESSYVASEVSGTGDNVGGMVGDNSGAIAFCYSMSMVGSTGSYVGGLIGLNTGTIDSCYSAGLVSEDGNNVGGMVGYNDGWFDSILNSFWDTDTTGQTTSDGGTGKTTTEMKTRTTFTDAGWDFTAVPIWKMTSQINNSYPSLAWQEPYLIELKIASPNGGESYSVGTTKTITWESVGEVVNVQLDYSTDNSSTWNNIKTVANTGSTTWVIPNASSSACLVKICDTDNPDIFDISDAVFSIHPAYPKTLTLKIKPDDTEIDTVEPFVGVETYQMNELITIHASRYVKCPNAFRFDHWEGDVLDTASATTQVLMDADKVITAVFVDDRKCGDECHPNFTTGDLNHDCIVDFGDFAILASRWMNCTKPECD